MPEVNIIRLKNMMQLHMGQQYRFLNVCSIVTCNIKCSDGNQSINTVYHLLHAVLAYYFLELSVLNEIFLSRIGLDLLLDLLIYIMHSVTRRWIDVRLCCRTRIVREGQELEHSTHLRSWI